MTIYVCEHWEGDWKPRAVYDNLGQAQTYVRSNPQDSRTRPEAYRITHAEPTGAHTIYQKGEWLNT